jgi:hypothetical protein
VSAFSVYQRGNGRMAPQFIQGLATGRPDAADRDAQPGADLRAWHWRILGKQGNQLLAEGGRSPRAWQSAAWRSAASSSWSAVSA